MRYTMISKLDAIKNRLKQCVTLLEFIYNGKHGNIDPYRTPEKGLHFLLYFDGYEKMVYDIEDVINTPFIEGKTLSEVFDQIDITDW